MRMIHNIHRVVLIGLTGVLFHCSEQPDGVAFEDGDSSEVIDESSSSENETESPETVFSSSMSIENSSAWSSVDEESSDAERSSLVELSSSEVSSAVSSIVSSSEEISSSEPQSSSEESSDDGIVFSKSDKEFPGGNQSNPFYHNRPVHRIPGIVMTSSGRLIAVTEEREDWSDHANKEAVISLSDDGGRTWHSQTILGDEGVHPTGNIAPVWDAVINRLVVLYSKYEGSEGSPSNPRLYRRYSDDEGTTWTDQEDITHILSGLPFTLIMPGPGHGIQLKKSNRGRLIVPLWGYVTGYNKGTVHCLYSDDHGITWVKGFTTHKDDGVYNPNESEFVELDNGDILVISRTGIQDVEYGPGMVRAESISKDGGETVSRMWNSSMYSGPVVMGSVLDAGDRLLYSSPLKRDGRDNVGVRESYDGGQTWSFPKQFISGGSAYSDLVMMDDNTVGMLVEHNGILFKSFDVGDLAAKVIPLEDASSSNSVAHIYTQKSGGTGEIVAEGKFGKGGYLDGGSYLHIAKNEKNLITGEFTMNFWYKAHSLNSDNQSLFWFFTLGPARDALWTRITKTGVKTLVNDAGEGVSDLSFSSGDDWRMFTMVRSGDDLDVYIDTDLKKTISGAFKDNSFAELTDFGYLFGARPNNGASTGYSEYFKGVLDEIKIYKKVLSESDIQDLYENTDIDDTELVVDVSFDY